MSRNVGKELPLRCVISQKNVNLIYIAAETWNHLNSCVVIFNWKVGGLVLK